MINKKLSMFYNFQLLISENYEASNVNRRLLFILDKSMKLNSFIIFIMNLGIKQVDNNSSILLQRSQHVTS